MGKSQLPRSRAARYPRLKDNGLKNIAKKALPPRCCPTNCYRSFRKIKNKYSDRGRFDTKIPLMCQLITDVIRLRY